MVTCASTGLDDARVVFGPVRRSHRVAVPGVQLAVGANMAPSSPPPTGNGSWSATSRAETVKDRWVFPLRADARRRTALMVTDAGALRRWLAAGGSLDMIPAEWRPSP